VTGGRLTSVRPFARDALGRIWISAIGVKGNVKTIFLYVIESANTPRRVNRHFGLSNRYHQRSSRLLQFRGGVMMVFSDDPRKKQSGIYTQLHPTPRHTAAGRCMDPRENRFCLIFRPDEHLGDRRLEAPSNFSETLPVPDAL